MGAGLSSNHEAQQVNDPVPGLSPSFKHPVTATVAFWHEERPHSPWKHQFQMSFTCIILCRSVPSLFGCMYQLLSALFHSPNSTSPSDWAVASWFCRTCCRRASVPRRMMLPPWWCSKGTACLRPFFFAFAKIENLPDDLRGSEGYDTCCRLKFWVVWSVLEASLLIPSVSLSVRTSWADSHMSHLLLTLSNKLSSAKLGVIIFFTHLYPKFSCGTFPPLRSPPFHLIKTSNCKNV